MYMLSWKGNQAHLPDMIDTYQKKIIIKGFLGCSFVSIDFYSTFQVYYLHVRSMDNLMSNWSLV